VNWFKSFWKKLNTPPVTPGASAARAKRITTDAPKAPLQASVAATPTHSSTETRETLGNFTPRAQKVVALAREEAGRFNHNFVGTEHLLLGLIKLGDGVAVNVLRKMGAELETVRAEVEKCVGTGPDQQMIGLIPFTPRVKKVLALANRERKALGHTYLGTEHILLGLLCEGDGVAARVFQNLGIDIEKTRSEILAELNPNHVPAACGPETPLPTPSPQKPMAPLNSLRHPLDTTLRYDVYCSERNFKLVAYRNVLIKSVKTVFPRNDHDQFSDFVELEHADGQTVFAAKSTIVRFCQHGVKLEPEDLSGPEK
jgi:hypothetical protein